MLLTRNEKKLLLARTVRAIYKERAPDGHFWSASTMRFWQSKLVPSPWRIFDDGRIIFITSDVLNGGTGARSFNIRLMSLSGDITRVNSFSTLHEAKTELIRIYSAS